jgi:diguanylate cyclase (GGDEF)-like protein/PAS domain S-box-containing protein
MTLRSKIFFSQALFLLAPLVAALGAAGFLVTAQQHQSLEQQAVAASTAVRNSMAVAADAARTGALRSMVRNNLVIIQSLYQKSLTGSLSLDEARWLALETFTNRAANTYGTLFCIDSRGLILAHPDTSLVRTPLAPILLARLREASPEAVFQVAEEARLPALFAKSEFAPWGWTIVASIPSREWARILPVEQLVQDIATASGSESIHPFVLDASGTFRPDLPVPGLSSGEGKPLLDQLARQLVQQYSGSLVWDPVPDNPLGRRTLFFQPITELNLIAGVAVPTSVLGRPWTRLLQFCGLVLLPGTLAILGLGFFLAHRLGRPLQRLATGITGLEQSLDPLETRKGDSEEYARIIACCNQMMSALHEQRQKLVEEQETNSLIQQQLHQEIATRREAEQKLRAENATRKSAEQYLLLFKNIFDNAIEGIYITDPEGRILTINTSFSRITGFPAAELIGSHPRILGSTLQIQNSFAAMWNELPQTGSWSGEIWNRKKDGSICPQWLSVSVIKNDRQEITHYFAFCPAIPALKRKEKQISILAYSDALTKLPNRAALEHRLTKAIARAGRERRTLAVFFIDLDNFKNINDSLGHNIGDQVLIEVAERLSATIRSEDTLSRLGGDEFILLSESIDNENAVYNLASRILASLKQPILLPPNTIYVNASIGIALFPNDGQTSLDLIKNADMAMYKAKSEGKNKFVMFTQEMNEKLLNRIRVESAIRTGLKQREFAVYYQPKINIISELPTSFEALVRWQNNGTIVTPDQFIPIAEESGLIDEMSLYVLDEVCIFLAKMDEHQLQRLPISVNMAPRTFNQKNIVETIDTILRAHRIDHRFIEFEITETTAMKNVQHTLEIMRLFRERGIRFSIDDFGTGYSSLSYLSEMPVSTLKIDKRFINAGDANSRSIVSSITAMSKQMQLNVVAEGVETGEQLRWLRRLGCDEAQGYYFSRPMPAADVLVYLQRSNDQPSIVPVAPLLGSR